MNVAVDEFCLIVLSAEGMLRCPQPQRQTSKLLDLEWDLNIQHNHCLWKSWTETVHQEIDEMICTKLHRKANLELKAVSSILWVIVDLNSGISMLPLSQSKELP
ncbi:hypothetical protein EK904_015175 [Melospiza melodia maxima]|nr:hypothetical protein EK904_015175 [Melospiza melodia maxima]